MEELKQLAKRYRLPEITTPEELECMWPYTLRFGFNILVAGYHYSDPGQNSWFGAVYRFTTDSETYESEVQLIEINENLYEDNGHAIGALLYHTYN